MKKNYNVNEKNHDIFNKDEFVKDVKKGVIVKDLMKKYNVSQYRVMKEKRMLDLLDIRYVNKMKKIKKTI